MRLFRVLAAVGSTLLGAGCALMEDTGRNLALSVGRCVEESHEGIRNRQWANQAWQQVAPIGVYSDDHADGFKEGYAEYLYRGGNGEPPVVAPPRYRRIAYQSPEGHRAVQDWFAGYRHGAAVAQAQGVRQWVTGPSALTAVDSGDAGHEGTVVRTMVKVYNKPATPVAPPITPPLASIPKPPAPTVARPATAPPKPSPPALPPTDLAAKAPVSFGNVSTAVPFPVETIPGIKLPASQELIEKAQATLPPIPAAPTWPPTEMTATAPNPPPLPPVTRTPGPLPPLPTKTNNPLPEPPAASSSNVTEPRLAQLPPLPESPPRAAPAPTDNETPLPPVPTLPNTTAPLPNLPARTSVAFGQPN